MKGLTIPASTGHKVRLIHLGNRYAPESSMTCVCRWSVVAPSPEALNTAFLAHRREVGAGTAKDYAPQEDSGFQFGRTPVRGVG